MNDTQQIVSGLRDFFYSWRFDNWYGLNPGHKPLAAKTRQGLLGFIKLALPVLDGVRDARIAEAIRQSGFEILEDAQGFYIERDTNLAPSQQATDESLGESVQLPRCAGASPV